MKKILSLLIAALLVAPVAPTLVGCGTTVPAKAAQGEKILIQSVNDGMALWADRVNAGKATQKQVDQVRKSYNDYLAAQAVAKAAIEKAITAGTASSSADIGAANAAVSAAEQTLLGLLNQLLN
jgi:hypothetical protein